VLSDPVFEEFDLAPLGPALANTVASTYPVASASSSVTWAFNPELGAWERQGGLAGPLFGERAETIGKGRLNLGFGYSYVPLARINGDDLDSLENQRTVGAEFISISFPDGLTLEDGRSTNFLPALVDLDLDVTAHLFTPSVTYGVTRDLDVNLTVPLVYSSLQVTTRTQVPDPRFLPAYACCDDGPPGNPLPFESQGESAFGIGDVLLRAKYVFLRGTADVAAGLGLSLPTGDEANFHGRGATLVQPALIASRRFGDRFEPLLNVGLDLNAANAGASAVRWAAGTTVGLGSRLTAAVVFLGVSEFGRQSTKIEKPFFFQIDRNDLFDASVGFRYRFAESGVVSANVLVPLNDQGLRTNVTPTFEVEYAF
jgi:hypothetical protein